MKKIFYFITISLFLCLSLFSQNNKNNVLIVGNDTLYCFNEVEINKITEIIIDRDTLKKEIELINNSLDIYKNLYSNCSKINLNYAEQIELYKEQHNVNSTTITQLDIINKELKDKNNRNNQILKSSILLNVVLIILSIL